MAKNNTRMERTLSLNWAGHELGLDETTRHAMTHVELFSTVLAKKGMSWEDAPDRVNVRDMVPAGPVGRLALRFYRTDEGFKMFEAAVNDPSLRPPLLEAYAQVLEISPAGQTMTLEDTFSYHFNQGE